MIPRTCLVLLSLSFLVFASELNLNLNEVNNRNALRRTVAICRPLEIVTGNEETEQISGSKRSLSESESESLSVGKKRKESESETGSLSPSSADSPFLPLPLPHLPETSSFPSCFKGSSSRASRGAVSFDPKVIEASTYGHLGIEAETAFFNALDLKKFNIAFTMKQQGLFLSNSSIVFHRVKAILASKSAGHQFIGFLFKHFPHVFTQKYLPASGSLFEGISQNNASLILTGYTSLRSAHLEIFKESVRNPDLNLGDKFNYDPLKYEQIQEMIQWAEEAKRADIIAEIITKAKTSRNQNSSLLFDAIFSMSLERIKLILERPDWIYLAIHKPGSGEYKKTTAVDLAIKMHDYGLDKSYEVMKLLLKVLRKIPSLNNLKQSEVLLTEFASNCIEADDNREIMKALKVELEIIINCDLETNSEIIVLAEDQLTHLLLEEESDEDDSIVIDDYGNDEGEGSETDLEEDVVYESNMGSELDHSK